MPEHVQMQIDETTPEPQRRIDKIVRALTQLSVRQTQGLFSAGGVQLNGQRCAEPWKWLAPGDRVDVEYETGHHYKAVPKAKKYSGFELVFEDQHLLVVNKQAQVLTVPTARNETDT